MALSEHEQRLLEQLEQQLHADDPKFANSLGTAAGRSLSTRHIVLGALTAVVGILVLLIGVSAQIIPVGVLGFIIMGAGVYWATTRRNGGRMPAGGSGRGKSHSPRSSFMSNLEDKWEERKRDQQ